MIFFTVKPKGKFPKQNKTKQQTTGKVWRKLSFKRLQVRHKKKMASCRLSSEIEGVKNRLSPVQQKSKIPVRRGTRLGNNSGTSPSSKDEVKMKQRIPRNRVEESQNKLPSRIPIAIGRASSKDVGRDKIPKSVKATTGKRPLGRDAGIVNISISFEAFSLSFKRQKFQPN